MKKNPEVYAWAKFRMCVPTKPEDIVTVKARIVASEFACVFEPPDEIKSFLVVEQWEFGHLVYSV